MSASLSSTPALALTGVTQRYGATVALNDVNLEIGRGSIHAILGENGAGKSTLVKILSGILTPTAGSVQVDGRTQSLTGTGAARKAGLATVFQELSLVPHLSIAENVMMTTAPRGRFGWIDLGAERRHALHWLGLVGLGDIDPRLRVMDLPLARRQLVEIAKALACEPQILIMDEATASLGAEQVETLFLLLRRLRDEGRTSISRLSRHRKRPMTRSAPCWQGANSLSSFRHAAMALRRKQWCSRPAASVAPRS
jgi:ribose transport system ATP-binding protein